MPGLLPHPTPVLLEQAVAVPGTAVPLAAVATYTRLAVLQAGRAGAANAGNICYGVASVDIAAHRGIELAPGEILVIKPPEGETIDLNTVYIDADNATDGVRGHYYPITTT